MVYRLSNFPAIKKYLLFDIVQCQLTQALRVANDKFILYTQSGIYCNIVCIVQLVCVSGDDVRRRGRT